MERKILITGGVLIGIFVIIILILLAHGPKSTQQSNISTQYVITPPPVDSVSNSKLHNSQSGKPVIPDSSTDANMVIPVKLAPKDGISLVTVTYRFVGRILQLDSYDTGVKIHLDNARSPVLPVPNTVTVLRTVNAQQIPAKFTDIQNNSRISLIATYNLSTAKWTVNRIILLPSSTNQQNTPISSSAATKK